jgi:energy-converting hydrogenase Eha subunit C
MDVVLRLLGGLNLVLFACAYLVSEVGIAGILVDIIQTINLALTIFDVIICVRNPIHCL